MPDLLRLDVWETMDIDYEIPRVCRVWTQVEGLRVCLHRIHSCTEELLHPHPWPSAVRILSGVYEMGVAYGPTGEGCEDPPLAAIVVLSKGSAYEMTDPNGWHYVRPLTPTTHSLMFTGEP